MEGDVGSQGPRGLGNLARSKGLPGGPAGGFLTFLCSCVHPASSSFCMLSFSSADSGSPTAHLSPTQQRCWTWRRKALSHGLVSGAIPVTEAFPKHQSIIPLWILPQHALHWVRVQSLPQPLRPQSVGLSQPFLGVPWPPSPSAELGDFLSLFSFLLFFLT